ncbi:MAG TPA: hypothetical protein VHC69_09055 [Polyangiaceae bacterium]|nr:hypothetical protein [Polyangiaceae bacterium]
MRRALVLAAAAIAVVAGISLAVPVTFSDGNVLGAKQLNDDFASVEQRLSALEARTGTGSRYTVRVSQIVALRGTLISALCNAGDRVVGGACSASKSGGGPMNIWKSEPIIGKTQGWACGADVGMFSNVVVALAICAGTGNDRSTDAGISEPIDAGQCPGSAIWRSVQRTPTPSCEICAAERCCDALNGCLLGGGCAGLDNHGISDSLAGALRACISAKCSCTF